MRRFDDDTGIAGRFGLGSLMRAARRTLGLSQTELAGRAGVRVESVAACERDTRSVRIDELNRIASALAIAGEEAAGDGLEGASPSAEEIAALVRIMVALPRPRRLKLQRYAQALSECRGEG
jgi:transcriptional regulator with XRE-family HTH domain